MVEVKVCCGSRCSDRGSKKILKELEKDGELKGKIEISVSGCMKKSCKPDNGPVIMVGDRKILKATVEKVVDTIKESN